MTPRTLWIILLKILGLYIFLQSLYVLPEVFAISVMQRNDHINTDILNVAASLLFTISIYLFMFAGLVFKTNWLIDKFRLDQGFIEEKIELNVHRSTVLRIAIIVTGAILFVDSLPQLLKELFSYYQEINSYNGFKKYPYAGWIIFRVVKVLISYFMMTSSRLIVNFIERKRKNKLQTENPEV